MLAWIIKIILISICFIFLVHYLIIFLKNMLTIPKTKDLVRGSSERYDKMYSILQNNNNKKIINISDLSDTIPSSNYNYSETTNIDALPMQQDNSMKDELKMFLKNQLNTNELEDFSSSNTSINYSLI